ncbi:uncharacterized protein N7500_010714 [Penicillium coprophilum]|uniref:uncharacterized protein n=1 Tax=Penicillium coprophilum TaxID=36646 RepID=UPI0023837609|nr:uncharacterized protein N7500_010714 [Penicillium coprophilum]KAJ5150525.1 hypothetical protein N7500_010714 [Penicillium coprophilum]
MALAVSFCDYESLYNKMEIEPNFRLERAAKRVAHPFYLADLEKCAAEIVIYLALTSGTEPYLSDRDKTQACFLCDPIDTSTENKPKACFQVPMLLVAADLANVFYKAKYGKIAPRTTYIGLIDARWYYRSTPECI